MIQALLVFAALLRPSLFAAAQQQDNGGEVLYDGCDIQDYYAGLLNSDGSSLRDDVTRSDLEALLESTHRKVLPYTSSNRDDVWKALIDLDPGTEPDTVQLIYRQVDAPARPYGTAATWNREHLWPKSWGVEYSGPDFTDIHHLRPADWNVNSARNNLYFGECGIVEALSECQSPAHSEAAADTAADSFVFLPPQSIRGDIARAILYMDVRYSNQNNDGLDLQVTDCPTEKPNEMAYKSQLLTWHIDDPVSEEERLRNQRACSRWQGNRNLFVDFPDLVPKLFGDPQALLEEGLGYPECENIDASTPSTSPPATSPTASVSNGNTCSNLSAGDVMMVKINSDNPEVIAMVALEDLGEGLELFLTDNAWTGSSFRSNEGVIYVRVPAEGIAVGTVFGYGASEELLFGGDWESAEGRFQLSTSGDSLILYCRTDDESIRFLSAFDFSGNGWAPPNQDGETFETSDSALPEALASSGAVSVPHFDNYFYSGPTQGSKANLVEYLSDPSQWDGSNEVSSSFLFPQFTVVTPSISPPPAEAAPSPLSAGDVMVVAMNSANPDLVALVALNNLPANLPLYLTDNAWTGSAFRTNEGTLMLTIPGSGIESGTIFGYGSDLLHGEDWVPSGGRFALAESGDTLIIYTEENGKILHLGAFSYSGEDWKLPSLEDESYGTENSALPETLIPRGAIRLPHFDNYVYSGPTEGARSFLQSALQNASNWDGSNTNPVTPPSASFTITSAATAPSSSWPAWLVGFVNGVSLLLSYL